MDRHELGDCGFTYVHEAFTADEAAAMRDVVWGALATRGIRRDDPRTWTEEAPSGLQPLKKHPAFRTVASERTIDAIDGVLGAGTWKRPKDWGAYFVLFPTTRPWFVPHKAWHCDHDYSLPLQPLTELKVHAMFGDVEPRAGGMTVVAGSHRLVAKHLMAHPPPPGADAAHVRHSIVQSIPYLRDLSDPMGDAEARIARFADQDEDVDGVPCRVVELTATAGDVILIHPLLLHTRPTNAGRYPRFLLNKDIYASS